MLSEFVQQVADTVISQPDSLPLSINVNLKALAQDSTNITLSSPLVDSVLVALHSHLRDSTTSIKDWIPVISGIVSGLIVVVIGGIIQNKIAMKSVSAQLMQAKRQNELAKKQIEAQTENAKLQIESATRIADKQIKATVLLTEHQRWLNSLRESIAEYTSFIGYAYMADMVKISDETMADKSRQLLSFQHRIILLLDHNEVAHNELGALIEKTTENIDKNSAQQTSDNLKEIILKSVKVIELESEKFSALI